MILYAVEYNGEITNYDNSVVTIHLTKEQAESAMAIYLSNWKLTNQDFKENYKIIEIDTEQELYPGCIYDYDRR